MTSATAHAHPNIALVKYWGKQSGELNIPKTPSVSATLEDLVTTTKVEASSADAIQLNGRRVEDQKILSWLGQVRSRFDIPPVRVESQSNFPASCGLASSSSGFAALTLALDSAFGLQLSKDCLSDLSRLGSASAARSTHGGFVSLVPEGERCVARQLHPGDHWDLRVVVAVTDPRQKDVPSTEGMARSSATSGFYESWCESTEADYRECLNAIKNRDFDQLAAIAEGSCCKLHALMLSSSPPLIYWNAGTMASIDTVRKLQRGGVSVFFTSDAGPQLKAFCTPDSLDTVEEYLKNTPGVAFTLTSSVGGRPTVE